MTWKGFYCEQLKKTMQRCHGNTQGRELAQKFAVGGYQWRDAQHVYYPQAKDVCCT
jgi:hypothetical protein